MAKIKQTKELSKDTYLSLSDGIKITMNELQFSILTEESEEIEEWLRTGTNHPYYIECYIERGVITNYVLFISEEDAVAFKLQWS